MHVGDGEECCTSYLFGTTAARTRDFILTKPLGSTGKDEPFEQTGSSPSYTSSKMPARNLYLCYSVICCSYSLRECAACSQEQSGSSTAKRAQSPCDAANVETPGWHESLVKCLHLIKTVVFLL